MSLVYIGGKPVVMPSFTGERARRQEIYNKEDSAKALQDGPSDLARVVGIMGEGWQGGETGAAGDHDSDTQGASELDNEDPSPGIPIPTTDTTA
ncbi:hypothetical protein HZC35_04455 [Candidatus Saganbacteria bacterium]|nr:hypothetical protein [Candidatus Saganbacteria bacterium]